MKSSSATELLGYGNEIDGNLLFPVDARGVLSEFIRDPDFKRLLNQVVLAQAKRSFRSLAVLSEFPGEGKTLLIAALALGFAQFLKKRVLIIDTVSPTRNESFYFGRVLGEEWAIRASPAGDSGIDLMTKSAVYRQIQYNQRHLYPELPNGALYSDGPMSRATLDFHIRYLLDSIRAQYDLILLDTCAMATTNREDMDPIILAKQAEGSILALSNGSLERQTLQRIKRELKTGQIELIGSIFNPGAFGAQNRRPQGWWPDGSLHGSRRA